MSKALQPIDEVRSTFQRMAPEFKALMPTEQHVQRFLRVLMTAIQSNPDLVVADRNSLYGAAMKCAQAGLLPDGIEAFLNVYNTKQANGSYVKVVQYQPMAEGMAKQLRNSGELLGAPNVQVVKEHDFFEFSLGDTPRIEHRPLLTSDRGKTVGAYSIVRLKDGEISREWMSIAELEAVRRKSKQPDSLMWKEFTDEGYRKTVFRRHCKKLPRSTDLDGVLDADNETYDLRPSVTLEMPVPQIEAPVKKEPRALKAVKEAPPMPDPVPPPPMDDDPQGDLI